MTDKPIKCGLCPVTCMSMEEWRIHVLIHMAEKKPFDRVPQIFKCNSIDCERKTKDKWGKCQRTFNTLESLLQHRRDAKNHMPNFIRDAHINRQKYRTFTDRYDKIPEFKNITDEKKTKYTRPKRWVPKDEYLVKISVGTKHTLPDLRDRDDKMTPYEAIFKNVIFLYRCPVEGCHENLRPHNSYERVEKHINTYHTPLLKPERTAVYRKYGKEDPEIHGKMKQRNDERKVRQRIKHKIQLKIWDSDAASPGNVDLERVRPMDYKLPRGVINRDGKEYSVCLHCGLSFNSIADWKEHSQIVVIPMIRAYTRHKTAIKEPNKFHSFKSEKTYKPKKEPEFWTNVAEEGDEQTTGKKHPIDEKALEKQTNTIRKYPPKSTGSIDAQAPIIAYNQRAERERESYGRLTRKHKNHRSRNKHKNETS